MRYTKEMLEAIAVKLRDMPPIEEKTKEYSKQDAVKILAKEITALKARGYTMDQIAETLKGEGLDISTPTLKNYLQRARPAAKRQDRRTKKDTPPAAARPAVQEKPTSKAKATFTPTPDSDDI
jgi:DNA-binding CsgD family transcriptional regulator